MTLRRMPSPLASRSRMGEMRTRWTALGRIAAWSFSHRRLVVGSWIVALLLVSGIGNAVGSRFNDDFGGGNSESQQALTLLQARFPAEAGDGAQVVFHTRDAVDSAPNRAAIATTLASLRGLADVSEVRGPFDPATAGQVSRSAHVAYGVVQFDRSTGRLPEASIQRVIDSAKAAARPGFDVELGGAPIVKVEKPDLGKSAVIGILAAVVILLVAFGSVIAMALPIVIAIVGVAITFGVLDLLSHWAVVPSFAPDLATLIGLGVGIDYALFIVSRYRQALSDGDRPVDAVVAAMATSGRAVLLAGSTVVISLFGLFLVGLPFIYGAASGAIVAVLVVMAASLTLLPAALGFAGTSIDRFRIPRLRRDRDPAGSSLWWRWSRLVQRRPWAAGAVALSVLVILTLPVFAMRQAFTDAGNGQDALTSRQAYDLIARAFGPGNNGPLVVAIDGPAAADKAVATRLQARLAAAPGVAAITPARFSPSGDTAVLSVIPAASPQDEQTKELVQRLRSVIVPAATDGTSVRAFIGGFTAESVDTASQFSSRLPLVITAVVIVSFLLLLAVFRSLAIPVAAALVNFVATGAAYGVLVAVFQWGWLGSLFHIGKAGPIDPWVPVFLFAILFGLSMDYEMFLLSRVREEWQRTRHNATAVTNGLAATGRVITSAAAIMVCVFGSFILGDVRSLKLFGLGMATAVLVDATLVRMLLVPAAMHVLGEKNWWFPRWLDRLVPSVAVELELEAEPQAA
jgi:RND superfamily putative drug exporter